MTQYSNSQQHLAGFAPADEQPTAGPGAARRAHAAVVGAGPTNVRIGQRYSRAQAQRARRGIAMARQALLEAA